MTGFVPLLQSRVGITVIAGTDNISLHRFSAYHAELRTLQRRDHAFVKGSPIVRQHYARLDIYTS